MGRLSELDYKPLCSSLSDFIDLEPSSLRASHHITKQDRCTMLLCVLYQKGPPDLCVVVGSYLDERSEDGKQEIVSVSRVWGSTHFRGKCLAKK